MGRRVALPLLVLAGAWAVPTPPVGAATTFVRCPDDDLQDALAAAETGDVIVVSGICEGPFSMGNMVTLRGSGTAVLDAAGGGPALTIAFGTATADPAAVVGLTLTGGAGQESGGGLRILGAGSLTVRRSWIVGNDATVDGGGIWADGGTDLTIDGSTIEGNSAGVSGGGLSMENAYAAVTNTTISGNDALAFGGGINVVAGEMDLVHTTVTDNRIQGGVGTGGGVWTGGAPFGIRNSILAGNQDLNIAENHFHDCAGLVNSNGANLVGEPSGCGGLMGTDLTEQDPLLGSLGPEGGPTPTHRLEAGSPAIGAALAADAPALDQRGAPRSAPDIGAYERVRCGGVLVNVVGTAQRDVLSGTPGPDGILGLGGNDRMEGAGGPDGMCGGPGNDTVEGGAGADTLLGERGDDRLLGNGGDDRLVGGPGRDRCRPGPGGGVVRSCERA